MKILVTGATGAIGSALTAQLASLGHTLLISARDHGKLEALGARIGSTTICAADLTEPAGFIRLCSVAGELGAVRRVGQLRWFDDHPPTTFDVCSRLGRTVRD